MSFVFTMERVLCPRIDKRKFSYQNAGLERAMVNGTFYGNACLKK